MCVCVCMQVCMHVHEFTLCVCVHDATLCECVCVSTCTFVCFTAGGRVHKSTAYTNLNPKNLMWLPKWQQEASGFKKKFFY